MPSGPRRIGEILIEIGALTNERLEEALRAQAEGGQRLGRILVDKKLVSSAQLERALSLQRGERASQIPSAGTALSVEETDPWLAPMGPGNTLDPDEAVEAAAFAAVDPDAERVAGPADMAALFRARSAPSRGAKAARREPAGAAAPAATSAAGPPAGEDDPLAALRTAARALEAAVPAAAGADVYAALVRAAVESGRFRLDDLLRALGVERGANA